MSTGVTKMLCRHSSSAYIDVYALDEAATLLESFASLEVDQQRAAYQRGAAAMCRTLALHNVEQPEDLIPLLNAQIF